jgi:ribosomal protein S18 acetylase RimI-like enzyme
MIRPARRGDLAALCDLERAAGQRFRAVGMADVADDDPPSIAELAAYQHDGRAWVTTDRADNVVAYLLLTVVDGNAHVDQLSVHPAYARRGLGRALLDTAVVWAAQRGLAALTLTTFANVPWNAPYYQRLGFDVVDDDQMSTGLLRIREHEAALGLARWPRVTMRRPIS